MIQTFDKNTIVSKQNIAMCYIKAHKENHYFYVASNKSEANRIVEVCRDISFKTLNVQPKLDQSEALELLLSVGANIAIVQDEFYILTAEMIQYLIRFDYRIIVDEGIDLFNLLKISPDDIQLAVSAGWLNQEFGEFGVTYENVKDGRHDYSSGRLGDLFSYANAQKVATSYAPSGYLYVYPVGWRLLAKYLHIVFLSPIQKGSKSEIFLGISGLPINTIAQ